jgi:hypothetical protein
MVFGVQEANERREADEGYELPSIRRIHTATRAMPGVQSSALKLLARH